MKLAKEFYLQSSKPGGKEPTEKTRFEFYDLAEIFAGAKIEGSLRKEQLDSYGMNLENPIVRNETVTAKLTAMAGYKILPRIFRLDIEIIGQPMTEDRENYIHMFDLKKTDKTMVGIPFISRTSSRYLLQFSEPLSGRMIPSCHFNVPLEECEYGSLLQMRKEEGIRLDFHFQEIPHERSRMVRKLIRLHRETTEVLHAGAVSQKIK